MDNLIQRIEIIDLSGEDLQMMCRKMGNEHTKWMLYEDLKNVTNIDKLFPAEEEGGHINSIFFLFQIRNMPQESIGHWAALIRHPKGKDETRRPSEAEYTYFDPYGLALGEDLKLTGEPPYLTNLLQGRKVEVNKVKYQQWRDQTQTCGRHVVMRAIFHFMNNKQYDMFIINPVKKMVMNVDVYVILSTMLLSKSDDVIRTFFKQKAMPGRTMNNTLDFNHRATGGSVF